MVVVKESMCAVDTLTNMIISYIPEAALESHVAAELSYVLPKEYCHKFEELFQKLEEDKVELGISSFGVSVTTLEEVFLK